MALYNPYSGGQALPPQEKAGPIPVDNMWYDILYPNGNLQPAADAPIQTQGRKASDILADVTRAQWADVKQNYLPIEKDIMQQLTFVNKDLMPESIASAQQASAGAADTVTGVRDRNIARYGITMGQQEQQAMADSDALTKSKNMVNAGNWTRQRLLDRDKELMLGGISAINGQ